MASPVKVGDKESTMTKSLENNYESMSRDQLLHELHSYSQSLTVSDRRRAEAEEKLHESEQRYQEILDDSAVCIWDDNWSAAMRELDTLANQGVTNFREYFDEHPNELAQLYCGCVPNSVSQGLINLYGAPSMEALLKKWNDHVTTEELSGFLSAAISFMAGESSFSYEAEEIKYDGSSITTYTQITVLRKSHPDWSRVVMTTLDVTDRKQAEAVIRRRAKYQALLAELTSYLVKGHHQGSGQQIQHGMELLGENYDVDIISLWWFDEDGEQMHSTHRWTSIDYGERPDRRNRSALPWLTERLQQSEIVKVEDIELLPAESVVEKEFFGNRGIKSFLAIPVTVGEPLRGFCMFLTLQKYRGWPDETIAELTLASESFAGAHARSLAMAEIEELKQQLQDENIFLREEVRLAHAFDEIIGQDSALKRSLGAVEKVAPTDVSVLILGETGTGKELIARSLHDLSARRDKPMVCVNCPALPENLIESELFGHEKGAFTGAQSHRKGRFELANGGTLFLDEIGELPFELQGKLLRVLQTGTFERLGGVETLYVDVRLIAATNRDLKQAAERGEFRTDLYYRINNFPIHLPALRDRKDDIPFLAEHFVRKHAEHLNKKVDAISAKMMRKLMGYSWPGNIRELESIIERALISSVDGSVLKLSGPLESSVRTTATQTVLSGDDNVDLATIERRQIIYVLGQTGWIIEGKGGAASKLDVPPSTLRSKMNRLGIRRQTA